MKVYVNGAAVDLQQRDFVAEGGEGKVFRRGDTGYKIYHDPQRMLPLGKIAALQQIQNPNVIRPLDVIKDAKGAAVGYTMRFIPDAWTLCQLFPKPFRDRNGVTHAMMLKMVQDLQSLFDSIHNAGVLLVDANEMNFLVTKDFQVLLAIDADSYQTPQYPATAIMASVRDWTVQHNQWHEGSDWFSFACVSFQMFTGIHPYKGKHPSADNMLEARMKAGISVLDKDVQVPPTAYDFTVIPLSYMEWYKRVFVKGERTPPPSSATQLTGAVPRVSPKPVTGTDKVVMTKLFTADANILDFGEYGGASVVVTEKTVWMRGQQVCPTPRGYAGTACSPARQIPVVLNIQNKMTGLWDTVNRVAVRNDSYGAEEAACYDGRMYCRYGDKAYEVMLIDGGAHLVAGTKAVAQIMPNASRLYPGVLVQNMLGSAFVSLFAAPGAAYQVRMPGLDKYRVMDAKFDKGVLMVVGERGGVYDRLVYRFDSDCVRFDERVVKDIQPSGLNFTVLDTRVCVCVDEQGQLELFSILPGSNALKLVPAPGLPGDAVLGSTGATVMFASADSLYSMKLK